MATINSVGTPEQQADEAKTEESVQELPEIIVSSPQSVGEYFNVSDFLARNSVKGLAKSNKFYVEIFAPPELRNYDVQEFGDLKFYCEAAEFPERSIITTDYRLYGPSYKSPNLSAYNDITLTLLCDGKFSQKLIFDAWMDLINPTDSFDFSYREDYISDIRISQLNDLGYVIYVVNLKEAYPISVNPIGVNWSDDNFNRLQVSFTYRYWIASEGRGAGLVTDGNFGFL